MLVAVVGRGIFFAMLKPVPKVLAKGCRLLVLSSDIALFGWYFAVRLTKIATELWGLCRHCL
jgi:hypothetical protein